MRCLLSRLTYIGWTWNRSMTTRPYMDPSAELHAQILPCHWLQVRVPAANCSKVGRKKCPALTFQQGWTKYLQNPPLQHWQSKCQPVGMPPRLLRMQRCRVEQCRDVPETRALLQLGKGCSKLPKASPSREQMRIAPRRMRGAQPA